MKEISKAFDDEEGDTAIPDEDQLNENIANDPNFKSAIQSYNEFLESLRGRSKKEAVDEKSIERMNSN